MRDSESGAKSIRRSPAGSTLDFAQRRGLDCTFEEKRRLLSVRLTFSVTGPVYKLDEFADLARYVVKWLNWFTSPGS